MSKEYEGTAYLGVVGPENEIAECRDSIEKIRRRYGDGEIQFCRATKGYEARQLHLNNMMESHHDWLFLMDHDQVFPPDALERLRSHKVPYVSGYYTFRNAEEPRPVWIKPFTGKFPLEVWWGVPERGKLHKLGGSGWGCLLVHREVIEATRKVLKGELEIIEDDMDIYPYDLGRVMRAIGGLKNLLKERPSESTLYPALGAHVSALNDEIKMLTGVKHEIVGSDIRFPIYALKAGYQLWGDPDVACGHMMNFNIMPQYYESLFESKSQEELNDIKKERARRLRKVRREWGDYVKGQME